MRLGSSGTHPFSLFERQRITAKRPLPKPRRPAPVRRAARAHLRHARPRRGRRPREGDPGRERPACRHAVPLLALSASSPFWRGEPTGLASSRQMVFAAFPRSGPPPRFRDYARLRGRWSASSSAPAASPTTRTSGGTSGCTRGSGRSRSASATPVTRVEDAVAIAAYCQALVKLLSERFDAGREIPSYHRILTSENKWLAARYGLEAPVMDLATGGRNRVPVAQLVRRRCTSSSRTPGSSARERELEGIREILGRGTVPTGSCASSTRTATSSRSCARSRTRPRLQPSPPRSSSRWPGSAACAEATQAAPIDPAS